MSLLNKVNGGYRANLFTGASERLINMNNVLTYAAREYGVSELQIIHFIKKSGFKIKTYSREKMSFGREGTEVFTTKVNVVKFLKYIKENKEAIIANAPASNRKGKIKSITIVDKQTKEIKVFSKQYEANIWMGYNDMQARDVTLREGKTYKGRYYIFRKEYN